MDLKKMLGENWDKFSVLALFQKITQIWKSL